MSTSQPPILIGLNYRDFPSNWRPAREEIAFAVRALDAEGGADRAQLNFDRPEGEQ